MTTFAPKMTGIGRWSSYRRGLVVSIPSQFSLNDLYWRRDFGPTIRTALRTSVAALLLAIEPPLQPDPGVWNCVGSWRYFRNTSARSVEREYNERRSLVNVATLGTNMAGMRARPVEYYSNGASVHYGGTNEMLYFWLARPNIYRINTIYTDDFLSTTFVATVIEANRGNIVREVTVAF